MTNTAERSAVKSVAEFQGNGYDFESTHLLCQALTRRTEFEARGFSCVLVAETLLGRFSLFFLGFKPAVQKPTRAERGCL